MGLFEALPSATPNTRLHTHINYFVMYQMEMTARTGFIGALE